jgi:ABC-type transporter Mla maintaining outer membrane lipid asymmetry ATPase subunit MlaF
VYWGRWWFQLDAQLFSSYAAGKKHIAIVTVLSMNPSILVLDKPSAGFDPRTQGID